MSAGAVVIAGGGTGGHLYPGLAVGEALVARGLAVTFVGTAGGIEARVLPAAGFTLRLLPGRQLRGGGLGRAALGLWALGRGLGRARRLLAEVRPGLVVGVGGYASAAVVLAAGLGRRPVLLLEQNVIPGAANRLLGRLARRVCVGFAESTRHFPLGRAVHTGNPIRRMVLEAPRPWRSRPGLLVFGGSAGAHRLNEVAVDAVEALGLVGPGFDVLHQTGAADLERVRQRYADLGRVARVEPFITDMGAAYAAADVVVARAGAMTCAEVTALGLPSVLVPYPHAVDDHQRLNAEALAKAGAAELIPEPACDGPRLARVLGPLLREETRRTAMGARARALGRPDAAERVAAECLGLLALEDRTRPL